MNSEIKPSLFSRFALSLVLRSLFVTKPVATQRNTVHLGTSTRLQVIVEAHYKMLAKRRRTELECFLCEVRTAVIRCNSISLSLSLSLSAYTRSLLMPMIPMMC
jgi:hypothetical protein